MKKIQYISPEIHVCELEVEQNMLLNASDTPANGNDALTNGNNFTDIWGNEY